MNNKQSLTKGGGSEEERVDWRNMWKGQWRYMVYSERCAGFPKCFRPLAKFSVFLSGVGILIDFFKSINFQMGK